MQKPQMGQKPSSLAYRSDVERPTMSQHHQLGGGQAIEMPALGPAETQSDNTSPQAQNARSRTCTINICTGGDAKTLGRRLGSLLCQNWFILLSTILLPFIHLCVLTDKIHKKQNFQPYAFLFFILFSGVPLLIHVLRIPENGGKEKVVVWIMWCVIALTLAVTAMVGEYNTKIGRDDGVYARKFRSLGLNFGRKLMGC